MSVMRSKFAKTMDTYRKLVSYNPLNTDIHSVGSLVCSSLYCESGKNRFDGILHLCKPVLDLYNL